MKGTTRISHLLNRYQYFANPLSSILLLFWWRGWIYSFPSFIPLLKNLFTEV